MNAKQILESMGKHELLDLIPDSPHCPRCGSDLTNPSSVFRTLYHPATPHMAYVMGHYTIGGTFTSDAPSVLDDDEGWRKYADRCDACRNEYEPEAPVPQDLPYDVDENE